jgi:hypothetical protein
MHQDQDQLAHTCKCDDPTLSVLSLDEIEVICTVCGSVGLGTRRTIAMARVSGWMEVPYVDL